MAQHIRDATPAWQAHPRGRLFGEEILPLSGPEILRGMMESRWPAPPLTVLADVRVSDVGLGTATMTMPCTPWWQSAAGVYTAGVLAFLADGALGCAVLTAAPPGFGMTTTGMALNFVRPATLRSRALIGRGRVVHATRNQALSEAQIEDGRGRLLAHGTSRGLLFPLDAGMLRGAAAQHDESVKEPEPFRLAAEGEVFGQEYFNAHDGIEILRSIAAGDFTPPVMRYLGLRVTQIDEGVAEVTVRASRWLLNAYGVMYGGALALVADLAMNSAIWTLLPRATSFAPLDLTISFLRAVPATGGEVRVRAGVTHSGRTIAAATCQLVDERDKLVATAVETLLILPGRPWERPVVVGDEMPLETAGAS